MGLVIANACPIQEAEPKRPSRPNDALARAPNSSKEPASWQNLHRVTEMVRSQTMAAPSSFIGFSRQITKWPLTRLTTPNRHWESPPRGRQPAGKPAKSALGRAGPEAGSRTRHRSPTPPMVLDPATTCGGEACRQARPSWPSLLDYLRPWRYRRRPRRRARLDPSRPSPEARGRRA